MRMLEFYFGGNRLDGNSVWLCREANQVAVS